MYDGRNHAYSTAIPPANPTDPNKSEGYFHELALANDSLAQLRAAMERDGTWGDSLVIVTADHSWRLADKDGYKIYPRIPFLCHFPGQIDRLAAPDKMNTLLVHDLLLDYLKGKVMDPSGLVDWVRSWTAAHPTVPLTDDPPNYSKNHGSD